MGHFCRICGRSRPNEQFSGRGHRIYVANGCFYCHSQQVRADYAGSDIDRKWGERRSAPRDYIFERPVELGKMRMGPDLANIGHRAPAEDQNAPAQTSPAPPNTAPGNPVASPAAGGSPVPATQNSPPPGQPTGSQPPSPAPAAATNVPANQAAKPADTPAPAQANAPSVPPPQASPAQPGNATSAAVTSSSPAIQQTAGAAASPEPSRSDVPPTYSTTWHHLHLYAPRSLNLDSGMPAYKFLYSKRRIAGQPSAEALKLHGEEAPGEGWEVVPTYDAECLVAYLMSLDQSHPLKEVKSIPAPPSVSSPAPAKAP